MNGKYRQSVKSSETHFTRAPMGEIEFSRMRATPRVITDFNAGDIVPIYCAEVLPHDTFDIGLHFDIRQSTIITPTMGRMLVDFYAFFVPNRVVNKSWKNVMGENSSGSWIAPEVSLAPLYTMNEENSVQIPVGSVADYYGFPTQAPIPAEVLSQCHDLKFRGYLEIYNNYFRDQNYQPPIPYSKLNIYNRFIAGSVSNTFSIDGAGATSIPALTNSTGEFGAGAIVKEFVGDGARNPQTISGLYRQQVWSAKRPPLKANKLHDYFTSVLPSPQKGRQVVLGFGGLSPLTTGENYTFASGEPLRATLSQPNSSNGTRFLGFGDAGPRPRLMGLKSSSTTGSGGSFVSYGVVDSEFSTELAGLNVYANLSDATIAVDELRMASAVQQLYEILGRSGSRYVEFINSFFGIEVDNPFDDIPTQLGHVRRELDLYQTAQTSASSADGSSSPQGNLAAFGYTSKDGHLFTKTFNEHGYIHIFAVVRHKNLYSTMVSRDNFRLNMLDFYSYPLANISEQPVYTREINPFAAETDGVFGYQEAWAEYRMEPDRVTGHMRTGLGAQGLDFWNYADDFDKDLVSADGDFMISNSSEVLARTTALSETEAPQFKALIEFSVDKQRPMPTYSVAGLDII